MSKNKCWKICFNQNCLLSAEIVLKELFEGIFRALEHSMRAGVYKKHQSDVGLTPQPPSHPLVHDGFPDYQWAPMQQCYPFQKM